MLRRLIEVRMLMALAIAAGVGTGGLRAFPIGSDQMFLAVIEARHPGAYDALVYGYAALWFSTPFWIASMIASLVTIAFYRTVPTARFRGLPAYPQPETRPAPSLVLGEAHHATRRAQRADIPQRGLYTGLMVLGAVGTGKTSACMYPYVDQLLRWRCDDADRKVGGLVMEVKGDFCRQVHCILKDAQRADDYIEIGLDTGVCYDPLHNDLNPYAVACRLQPWP